MTEAGISVFAKRTLLQWQAPVPITHTGAPYLPGNPFLLWEMVPGERVEVGANVYVNRLGFRGTDTTVAKPPGTRRIVIVGDSSVYGHGVSNEQTFSHLLDADLPADIEVINLGAPGYSSAQTLNLLALRGWALKPDLLVIGNLWSDNNFDSFIDKYLLSDRTAFEHSIAAPISRVFQRSRLYRWLDWHLRLAPRAKEVQKVGWMLGRAPSGVHRRVAINDYADNLQSMVDSATSQGADVAFLALANTVDLGAETDGAIAWPLYREVMADTASRNGAPYIDVLPQFQGSDVEWRTLFLDEMHPSTRGHKLIAELLAEKLDPWVTTGTFGLKPSSTPAVLWDDPFARGEGPAVSGIPVANITLSGTVVGAPEGMPIQIDLINLDPDRPHNANPMLGSARFDHVETFEMPAPSEGLFGIRIYLDKEADGPTSGDPIITLYDTPIEAKGASIVGVTINLKDKTIVQGPMPMPTTPLPQPIRDAADTPVSE
jgi:lysophospholipase L1-like esterase